MFLSLSVVLNCGQQTSFELFGLRSSGGLVGSVAVSWSAVCFSCSAAHQKFTVVVAFGWNASSHLQTRDPPPLLCAQSLAALKHALFNS